MSNELDLIQAAAALRDIGRGFIALADVLAGGDPRSSTRKEALARILGQVPPKGIRSADLSALFRAEGLSPRAIGAFVQYGQLVADKDNALRASAERIYTRGE